jgi:hypothetical protein
MKRIVLFVEGEGEATAVPNLIGRILTEQNALDAVFLDDYPFRVGQINKLVKNEYREWKRKLSAAKKRSDLGAVLVVSDGDIKRVGGNPFCASEVARSLAIEAVDTGAGSTYSAATVFACQEFESWLIAGIESVAGKPFPDGRIRVKIGTKPPDGDLEQNPRAAKEWLREAMVDGYKPTRDQASLTRLIDLQLIRNRKMRSFQRLESAVEELVTAIRDDAPIVTPFAS